MASKRRIVKNGSKIICPIRTKRQSFYYTEEEYYCSRALHVIKLNDIDLKYLTGILNSQLVYFWLLHKGKIQGEVLKIDKEPLLAIPIPETRNNETPSINPNTTAWYLILSKQMLDTQKKLHASESEQDKKHYQQKVDILDKQIDTLVYELYELTPAEIKIVEEAR